MELNTEQNDKCKKRELPQLETVDTQCPKGNRYPFKKYRGKFKTSFWSMVLGMLLVVMGFVLIGYSEGIYDDVNTIKRLNLVKVEQINSLEKGMTKIIGQPMSKSELMVENCTHGDLIFHHIITEKFDGENWVQVKSRQAWINFQLGDIDVIPGDAETNFDFKVKEVLDEYKEVEDGKTIEYRETLYGVSLNEELIVIGEINDRVIAGGKQFIITNKSHKDLISLFVDENSFLWWGCKTIALFLLVLGIVAFVLPIISFLDIFPAFGWGLVVILTLIAIAVNLIVVFFITLMLTFWWLIGLIILFILYLVVKIKSHEKELPNSLIS
jgi:hypothetical protein